MKRSLRGTLIESHVAAVSIAVLLAWSLDLLFRSLWPPLSRTAEWLFMTVAIMDIPSFSFGLIERTTLLNSAVYLYAAIAGFSAAWILSRWTYGVGPLRSLATCGEALATRRKDVRSIKKDSR